MSVDQWAQVTIAAVAPNTATLSITACTSSGGHSTYTYTVSQGSVAAPILGGALYVIITGMKNSGNDGVFTAGTFGAGTFTVANASPGANESGSTGTGACPSDSGVGICVRGTTDGENAYVWHTGTNSYSGDGRIGFRELWRLVSGTGTFMDGQTSGSFTTPAIGDVIQISAEGHIITGWYSGSPIFSVSDTNLTTGLQGITAWSINGLNEYNWSQWVKPSTLPANTPGNNGTQANDYVAGTIVQEQLEADASYSGSGDLHTANPNWVYEGLSSFGITSTVVYNTGSNPGFAYRADATTNADQYSQVTAVITGSQNTQNCGPAVRISAAAQTAYMCQFGNSLLRIGYYLAGVFHALASTTSYAVTGDTLRLVARGTNISLYHNGVAVLGANDSTIATGSVGMFGAGTGTVNGISAWSGGNYTWAPTQSDTFVRANGALANNWGGPYPNQMEQTSPDTGSINIVSDAYSSITAIGGDAYALFAQGGQPTLTLTPLAVDDFHRPNSANLGTNWTVDTGGDPSLTILSNQAVADATDLYGLNYYSGVATPNDQYAEMTVGAVVSDAATAILYVRATTDANNGYGVSVVGPLGARTEVYIFIAVNGNIVAYPYDEFIPVNVGDTIGLAAIGPIIYLIHNGTPIFKFQDAHLTSGVPILYLSDATAQSDVVVTNFVMGSASGSAPAPSPSLFFANSNAGYGTDMSTTAEFTSLPAGETKSPRTSIIGTNRGARIIG